MRFDLSTFGIDVVVGTPAGNPVGPSQRDFSYRMSAAGDLESVTAVLRDYRCGYGEPMTWLSLALAIWYKTAQENRARDKWHLAQKLMAQGFDCSNYVAKNAGVVAYALAKTAAVYPFSSGSYATNGVGFDPFEYTHWYDALYATGGNQGLWGSAWDMANAIQAAANVKGVKAPGYGIDWWLAQWGGGTKPTDPVIGAHLLWYYAKAGLKMDQLPMMQTAYLYGTPPTDAINKLASKKEASAGKYAVSAINDEYVRILEETVTGKERKGEALTVGDLEWFLGGYVVNSRFPELYRKSNEDFLGYSIGNAFHLEVWSLPYLSLFLTGFEVTDAENVARVTQYTSAFVGALVGAFAGAGLVSILAYAGMIVADLVNAKEKAERILEVVETGTAQIRLGYLGYQNCTGVEGGVWDGTTCVKVPPPPPPVGPVVGTPAGNADSGSIAGYLLLGLAAFLALKERK